MSVQYKINWQSHQAFMSSSGLHSFLPILITTMLFMCRLIWKACVCNCHFDKNCISQRSLVNQTLSLLLCRWDFVLYLLGQFGCKLLKLLLLLKNNVKHVPCARYSFSRKITWNSKHNSYKLSLGPTVFKFIPIKERKYQNVILFVWKFCVLWLWHQHQESTVNSRNFQNIYLVSKSNPIYTSTSNI